MLNCTLRDDLIPSAFLTACNIKVVKLFALSESVSQTVICCKTDTQLVLLGGTSTAAPCAPCADRHWDLPASGTPKWMSCCPFLHWENSIFRGSDLVKLWWVTCFYYFYYLHFGEM